MVNEVSTFAFGLRDVRVVTVDGAPWFVAADVCRAIGVYVKAQNKVNVTPALQPLLRDEKGTKTFGTPSGQQVMRIISESGLYKLTLRSQRANPRAAAFQDWVTREVLPSIRKTGSYSVVPATPIAAPRPAALPAPTMRQPLPAIAAALATLRQRMVALELISRSSTLAASAWTRE